MRAVVARLDEEGEAFFTNASPIAAGVPRAPTMNLSILITAYLAVYAATTGKTAPDVAEDLKPIDKLLLNDLVERTLNENQSSKLEE